MCLSGCGYALQDCSKHAGTDEYNQCLAVNGDQNAQYALGSKAYVDGDMDEAIKWLEKAAEPGPDDKLMYMPAVGGQSSGTVMRMPNPSATKGNRAAQQLLVKIYSDVVNVPKNEKKAEKYRELASGTRM